MPLRSYEKTQLFPCRHNQPVRAIIALAPSRWDCNVRKTLHLIPPPQRGVEDGGSASHAQSHASPTLAILYTQSNGLDNFLDADRSNSEPVQHIGTDHDVQTMGCAAILYLCARQTDREKRVCLRYGTWRPILSSGGKLRKGNGRLLALTLGLPDSMKFYC